MENKPLLKALIFGGSLVLGLFILGFFMFNGLKTFSDKDRVVTVKGLAEMDMTATAASISISFSFSGDNLKDIVRVVDNKKNSINTYLNAIGYTKKDIQTSNLNVTDRQKYYETRWSDGKEVQEKIDRYTVTQTLTIQSKEVIKTEDKAATIELDLINKDLTSTISTSYSFPDLNSIKPKLIAESTKNARVAGEQFANDSQAKLGKIKTASQGQITIAGEYYGEEGETSQKPKERYIQKARVVSTIVFFLE